MVGAAAIWQTRSDRQRQGHQPTGAAPIAPTIPMQRPMIWRCAIETSPERWRPTSRAARVTPGKTWSRSPWWASSWPPALEATTSLELPPTEAGVYPFHCGMNMVRGVLEVVDESVNTQIANRAS